MPQHGVYMPQRKSVSRVVLVVVALLVAPSLFANTDNDPLPTGSAAISHARVVSLSLVEGMVIARAPGSTKWIRATMNTPIQEGVSLATAKHSFAEVQFENGSTLRLGELSSIEFKELALAPHGAYSNEVTLVFGVATLNVIPQRHDEYVVNASGASLTPHGRGEFRTDLSRGHLRVEVFHGRVETTASNRSENLRKNHTLVCDFRAGSTFQVTRTIQKDQWDKWVQTRDREAKLAAYRDQPDPLYNWGDLIPWGGMGTLAGGGFGGDGF